MTRKRQRSSSSRDSEGSDDVPVLNVVDNAQADVDEQDGRGRNNNPPTIHSTTTADPPVFDDKRGVDIKHEDATVPTRRALVWFRRDLRLHDNLALDAAIRVQQQMQKDEEGHMALLPIYIVHRPRHLRCGPVRFQFVLEAIEDLAKSIANLQGRLLVLRGDADDVLPTVMAAWKITDIFFEAGVLPYAVERDNRARAVAKELKVQVTTCRGVTLYDPHEIIRLNDGRPPTDYEVLLEITENMAQPAQPIAAPGKLENAAAFSSDELFRWLNDFCKDDSNTAHAIAGVEDAKSTEVELFVVPSLTAMGLTPPDTHTTLIGGESEALKRLDEFCKDKKRVGLFEKPKTSPVAVNGPSTTAMSAYLSFGCLSAREFFYRIMFIQLQFPLRPGPTQITLEGQLMWREFFYCYAVGTPNFDSQEQNPGCKQIEWRLLDEEHVLSPEYDLKEQSLKYEGDDKLAMHQLQCWKEGRTGFPWIDAVMRQINQEGWTHHAGRHAAACFLTRGVLYISWLRGAAYFQEKMIDLDWAINVGNWLWVSASCFFSNYRRVASPSMFPQRWDPQGHFIRKYIPALRKMPDKFVHEPWKAPLKVQRDAGCLIGKHYPFPIVDSKLAMSRCIAGMSQAYSDSETESTTSSATSSRTQSDDTDAGGSSPWSTDDMCYNYRGSASNSQPK
ncbi:Cryptochrome [Phytophthora megakarya]|uniref:Cryptochrome n=1 Tax=Phytophthora megakarya TaxID=4795 RepID=A0A225VW24_9STRA|nr:Cryptochrome [Phytophthora megakarya]